MLVVPLFQKGHIYMVDYPELRNVYKDVNSHNKNRSSSYITCPSCLFYLQPNKDLVPIAIQLHPGDDLIWTPQDNKTSWIYAKMWMKQADAHVHLLISRHLCTNVVIEAIAMATYRNLPGVHPINKLLQPHIKRTIVTNATGKTAMHHPDHGLYSKLLATGNTHEKFLKEGYRHFHFDQLNLPKDLMSRHVIDPVKLPNYWYRDDGLQLWKIVEKMVRTVLTLHYWQDTNVEKDEELQAWIWDIHTKGLPTWENVDHGLPATFTKLTVS